MGIVLIVFLVLLLGCNLEMNRILLQNQTSYTVFLEYRDGTTGSGADNWVIAEVPPNSEKELYGVEFWQGSSGNDELLVAGHWTDNGTDVEMDQVPGTLLWPLTVIFKEL